MAAAGQALPYELCFGTRLIRCRTPSRISLITMTATQRTITRVRRRLTLRFALGVLGYAMLAAAVVAVAVLVAMQWSDRHWPAWAYTLPFGGAVLVTAVLALTRRWGTLRVAQLADERLHLKDTLGTSLYVAELEADERTAHVAGEAERRAAGASRADLRAAFPLLPRRGGRAWAAAVGVMLVFTVLAFDPFGLRDRVEAGAAERDLVEQRAAAVAEALVEAAEEARAINEPQERDDGEGGEAGEALDPADLDERLDAILTRRDLTNPENRRAAEAEVSDLQERFAERVERERQKQDRLENAMSPLDPGERGPADDFTKALRRGDFEEARRELAGLAKDAADGELGEGEKQRLTEQLESLSDQLEEQAAAQERSVERDREELKDGLKDAGVEPAEAERLSQDDVDPEAVRDAVRQAREEQGVDPSQAERDAERAAERKQQSQQTAEDAKQTQEKAEGLASKLGRLADAMKEGQPAERQSQEAQEAQRELGEMAQEAERTQRMQQAGEKLQEAQQQMAEGKDEQGADPSQRSEDGEPTPPKGDSQQAGGERPSPGEQPGDGPPKPQPGQQQAQQGQPAPGGAQPSQQQAGAAPSPDDTGPASSPGPGEGDGGGGDPLGDGDSTRVFDRHASHDIQQGTDGRVTTSWTNDGESTTGTSTVAANRSITQGRAEAERAVSEDRAPQRYHRAIREYFDNLPEE